VAASIGGLVTSVVAAPAPVGFLIGLSSNGTNIIDKDFLYGSDNISTIYDGARQAEATDKVSALPEPDNSDSTFAEAMTVIQQHQDICHPNKHLGRQRVARRPPPSQVQTPLRKTTCTARAWKCEMTSDLHTGRRARAL
jgi:hypothetical protein